MAISANLRLQDARSVSNRWESFSIISSNDCIYLRSDRLVDATPSDLESQIEP